MEYLSIKQKDIYLSISKRTWERSTTANRHKKDQVGKRALEKLIDDKQNQDFKDYLNNHFGKDPIAINDFFERLLDIVRKWDVDAGIFRKRKDDSSTIIGVLRQAFFCSEVCRKSNVYEFKTATHTLVYKKDGTVELSCECCVKVNAPISKISFGTTAAHPTPVYAEQGQKVVLSEPRGGKKEIVVLLDREYIAGETVQSGYKINLIADDDYSLHYNVKTPVENLTLNVIFENYQAFPEHKAPTKYLTYSCPQDYDELEAEKKAFTLNKRLSYSPQNPKLGYQYIIQWYFD